MDVIWRSSLSVAPSGWWWEAASWPRTCTCGTGSAWWSCPGTRPGPGGSPSSGWTSATTGSTASLTVPAHSPETRPGSLIRVFLLEHFNVILVWLAVVSLLICVFWHVSASSDVIANAACSEEAVFTEALTLNHSSGKHPTAQWA